MKILGVSSSFPFSHCPSKQKLNDYSEFSQHSISSPSPAPPPPPPPLHGRLPPPLPARPPSPAVLGPGPHHLPRQWLLLLRRPPSQRILLLRAERRRFPRRRRPADRDLHDGASASPPASAPGTAPASGEEGWWRGERRQRRGRWGWWKRQHVVLQRPGDETAAAGGELQGLLSGRESEVLVAEGPPLVQGQVLRYLPRLVTSSARTVTGSQET